MRDSVGPLASIITHAIRSKALVPHDIIWTEMGALTQYSDQGLASNGFKMLNIGTYVIDCHNREILIVGMLK